MVRHCPAETLSSGLERGMRETRCRTRFEGKSSFSNGEKLLEETMAEIGEFICERVH